MSDHGENEKDDKSESLYSFEKPEEQTIKVQTPEVVDEEPQPEYTNEDLQTLVRYTRDMTFLYDLRNSDWNETCEEVIKHFFLEPKHILMTIYFEGDTLMAKLGAPDVPIFDLTYFIRSPLEVLYPNTFHDRITFGTMDSNFEGAILKVIETIYAPVFFKSEHWPESVKNSFCHNLHMFLAKLTDIHHKLLGLTVLYMPKEANDLSVEDASNDKELIKRLEAIIVYWTKQIRVGLQDQDQTAPDDLLCLIDEYDFWIYRYENLSGLNYQMSNKTLKHICDILIIVQSNYVRQFLVLEDEIEKNLQEAKSNIEYLQILREPCIELGEITNPLEIPEKLGHILQLIRFIWIESPYYNSTAKITTLCRALSNQLIIQCSNFIDLKIVFKEKKTRKAIQMFETCIECLTKYIKTYVLISQSHNTYSSIPWLLDKAPIFNHVDSFIQRCKDMIEICEAMIHFGRYDEFEDIPKPTLGAAMWEEFDNWCIKIENMFRDSLKAIFDVRHLILNVHVAEWYDHMLDFRNRIKDIEVVIENLTNAVFEEVGNVEEAIENLGALHIYTKRNALQPLFEAKTLQVYNMFKEEIHECKQDLNNVKFHPCRLPFFSGCAMMLTMKKNRLNLIRQLFRDAQVWMLPCSIAKEIFSQQEKLAASIDETITTLYRRWVKSIGEDVQERLNRSLMCKSATKPGLIECNIDRTLLDIQKEARYWESLKFEVPDHIKNFYKKSDTLIFVYESVLTVCVDYNKIVSSLSDEERLLFRPLIAMVEKKIYPGLCRLTWSSDVGDEYVSDCCALAAELQKFVDDYKTCNLQIVGICEKICDTPLIRLNLDHALHIEELVKEITKQIETTINFLISAYHEMIQFILVVYKGFETHMNLIANQWIKYVNNFDILVEEALRICCKNSLKFMYETLHGDDAIGPNPVLLLKTSLKENHINFAPSLSEVATVIYNILPNIVIALKVLPRLNDKFHVSSEDSKFYWEIIENDDECQKYQLMLKEELDYNVKLIQEYMKVWEPFRDLWEVNKDEFIEKYSQEKPEASQLDANIGRYTEVANNVQVQDSVAIVHFIKINCASLKKSIIEHCVEWQQKLCHLLYSLTYNKIQFIYDYMKTNSEIISREPTNLQEMVTALQFYDKLIEDIPVQAQEFPLITDQMIVLDKYNVEIPPAVRQLEAKIFLNWNNYVEVLHEAEKMLGYSKGNFKSQLLEQSEEMKKNGKQLLEKFLTSAPFTFDYSAKDALKYLMLMRKELAAMRGKERDLMTDLAIFGLSLPESLELGRLEKELETLELVWQLTDEWDKAWSRYKTGEFWKIETHEMEDTAQTLFRRLSKLSKEFKEKQWTIIDYTKDRVDAFRKTLPLIADLKNPAMRSRHWDRVRNAIQKQFDENSANFNLEVIDSMEMYKYTEQIKDISLAATMELQIENNLINISGIWKTMSIEFALYRDDGIYRIKNTDDCFQSLEDNMVQLSNMKSSRYVEPFSIEVDFWEKTLSYILETLELALIVQKQWIYFDNIFTGEDIKKQLPKETEDFLVITDEWRNVTQRMNRLKKAFVLALYKPIPYLFDHLSGMNHKLENIQRALESYLETKRQLFPRFYFISNDDLLEILGSAKKPEALQIHLKKIFDNVIKLKTGKNVLLNKPEAYGMFSEDGEYVEFLKPVNMEGPVELWLIEIEKVMKATLKRDFKPCRNALRKASHRREKWLLTNNGQLCYACSHIQWTSDCTRALVQAKILESKKPIRRLRKKQNLLLNNLSEMSRKDLTKLQRIKANSLITIEIHSRDVIDKLYKTNCRDVNSFEWFSQLRFYWDRDTDDCIIKQTNTSFIYGYEYNGNSGKLVITPLTDRCFITLTTALHLHRGGSPKGPAGTGKTETVKDLGKTMGMWVIVTNCSEGLDYKSMGKSFSGLAQTGVWGCFDEFNRINIEVLSVVAQQILSILSAVSQKAKRFVFEGTEINLKFSVGIFITMNPGYAGRTELPENLKAMFRPISMMVPDSSIIAENILFSDGFQNTKSLAKKVYTLYQLAIQQLSKQDHYDFGLRSMVALLRYGGQKRRQYPNLPEDQVIYLAMKDMNIARLTSDDVPLFSAIMSDIFPGVSIPTIDYHEITTAIIEYMNENNLQPIPVAISKVIQLYETKNSRHSVMMLGKTCTAKTTTWKTLQGALKILNQKNKSGIQNVFVYPINPKALNLSELFGEFNLSTNEWLDGVISTIMRSVCLETTLDEKWILFDGPVDALWIENMNSVMDDNKVLTLINSDRITMPEQVSLLFEVGDLAVASPATVSRCGMVYNDYKDWGWKPYVTSWIQSQSHRGKQFQDLMTEHFDYYVQKLLDFKRLNCDEIVGCVEFNLVKSLCILLETLATVENGVNPNDENHYEEMIKLWFLFCLTWSICITTNIDGRRKFDSFIREKEGAFPIKDTIYEYFVDTELHGFTLWEIKLPYGWKYDSRAPFYEIIVPTVDTIRYEYIVKNLLYYGHPVLLTGPIGTGKTSSVQSVVHTFNAEKYILLNVNMSAQTTALNLQETIESRLEKRTKGVYTPLGGKILIAFLDDLNMPAKDSFGSQPPLELLRQWLNYNFWYDRQKQSTKQITNTHIVCSMGPPGGGRNVISDRLLSCFNVINMTFPDESNILRIFGTMLGQHLLDFNEPVKVVGREIIDTTIDLYNVISTKMLPTPTKIHYLFNLRDISRIFQGLLRSHKNYHGDKVAMLRLWLHECFRVFYDRLIDDKDQEAFIVAMNDQLAVHFDLQIHNLCPNYELPIFGDFINPHGIYEDILDITVLRQYLEEQLKDYNATPGVVKLDLVLFQYAIQHVCRIIRVISQARGNMLLVGIGGSGRICLSRIASYICEYALYKLTITRNYKLTEFREDLKILYNFTGIENRPTCFVFSDTQIVHESFLEIINNMLSSGEVPNLYKQEEFDEIKNRLTPIAQKTEIIITPESLYNFLINRVRKNLHIVLCMSPIGVAFRNRLRQYPAIANCTTIDWYFEWPKDALLEVANKFLSDINFVETITGEKQERRRESILVSTQDVLKYAVSQIFSIVHESVSKCAQRMLSEIKRYCYITPKNFFELVIGYKKMLSEKRYEVSTQANKLRSGVWKIDDCRSKVETMSVELQDAQVKVAEFQQQCDDFMVQILAQKKQADEQQKEVAKKSVRIKDDEIKCQNLADIAQADLDEAMPALEAAIAALDSLSKKDISEMKSYGKPPQKVEMVMEAVMILKGVDKSWAEAKRQLGDMKFLENLKEFDKNNISDKTLKKINTYTTNEEFVPEKVGIVSLAAKSLCLWVIAIEKYAKVWKVVAPKKAKLDDALKSLKEKQMMLAEAQAKLAELNAMLQKLQKDYEDKLAQKEELNRKAELLKLKLERANILVECLAGERIRWLENVVELDIIFEYLPGDCLIATAFISYLGPFVTSYREELIEYWKQQVFSLEVPSTKQIDIIKFLCDATTIREWNIQGLPADNFSTENGIIITRGSRWPLIIDPQLQALKWIKNKEKENNLQVVDFGMRNYLKVIEEAIQFGNPILLQNIGETLDPTLDPVLTKSVIKLDDAILIKINDKLMDYNENFRLFIVTKLMNPDYSPEIFTKLNIVNFAVKEQGLEGQLLGIVVRKERPQLEEQKDKLVTTISKGKKTLIDLENELLRLLNETRGSLLEDAELFNTLQTSKATSIAVQSSVETSETNEIQIDIAREGYRPCAERASILFFVLVDLGRIDPMYQFSLDAYIDLYIKSIQKSTKSHNLNERINFLNDYHTLAVYKNTCRTLFERHKLLFSFHMCVKILNAQNKIIPAEYNFLLKGGVVLDKENQMDNPCPQWLCDEGWDNITELDKLGGFHGITDSFEQFSRDWHTWYTHTEPESLPLIGEWNDICNQFQKMLFIRSLRQDRMSFCISNFIVNQLGPKFIEPPGLEIKTVLEESSSHTPLIFVLSPGVDPTYSLIQLADASGMSTNFHSLSLGQGQAPFATKMIQIGAKEGHWVFLANCHLSMSWMPKLDKIIETLQMGKIHPNFRLWLSSNPHPDFPISILQTGIKMTTEPPKGLKANLRRLYQLVTEDQFSLCKYQDKYKKLLFSLCFFHSVLLERKKFQQLGWNVVYSFNNSDFEVSENLLTIYLDEYQDCPWDALKYLIAGINYGGHVTDEWDRRLLHTYINQYFCEDIVKTPYFRLSNLSTYYIPKDGSIQSYLDYIRLLPNVDKPEVFGQHPNADITSQINESKIFCDTLMSLEIQALTKEAETKEEKVSRLAAEVLAKIPVPIDYDNTVKLIGTDRTPLRVVLLQEILRYNALLIEIKRSLADLQNGIKGLVVMSTELEEICLFIYEGRVPPSWLKAYSSLKLLGSWTRDLIARIHHFAKWAETTHPPLLFWLAAYTFPTAFLTAVLQTTARSIEIPIDALSWEFNVLTVDQSQIVDTPESGVYVRGLFLEGAGWDKKKSCLVDPQPMQLVCSMPLIHFKPVEQMKKKTKGLYSCPCYYFPIRAGTPTRDAFVVAVDLKSGIETPSFWVKRGTALLLSLDN